MASQTESLNIRPKLIIGLGNPGKEYESTYHNAGFLFLDYLAEQTGGTNKFRRPMLKRFEFADLRGVTLVKPRTFMNRSGDGISDALRYFKIGKEDLLVAHDDSDLPIGKYKIVFGSGAAGHHGTESAIKSLKGADFRRIRFGIRSEFSGKAGDFVLKNISQTDLEKLRQSFRAAEMEIFGNG